MSAAIRTPVWRCAAGVTRLRARPRVAYSTFDKRNDARYVRCSNVSCRAARRCRSVYASAVIVAAAMLPPCFYERFTVSLPYREAARVLLLPRGIVYAFIAFYFRFADTAAADDIA